MFIRDTLAWLVTIPFFAFIAFAYLSLRMAFLVIFLAFLFGVLLSLVVSKLTYHFYKYDLLDHGFYKETGIIFKSYATIPYDRIQNVDIYRGIFDRMFGLSTLRMHTAGIGGIPSAEGSLSGISKEEAVALRDEVLNRAREARSHQGGL